jgi:uncharacterized protein
MTRVTRDFTPRTTLDSLRKMAKRWLKDIEAGDELSLARFRDVFPAHDGKPKLREVQHALSHEFGFSSWAALKQEIEDRARSHADLVRRFLEKGANRYGVEPTSGKWISYERDGGPRGDQAVRVIARRPEIAREDIHTAVLAHDMDAVRGFLARDPSLANHRHPFDGWTPLIRLAYARLPLPAVEQNALLIARLLLDAGADAGANLTGDAKGFTVLTGVIGGGEGGQSAHPQAEAFARLLIAHGADPLDGQALYNTSLGADDTFWLDLLWAESEKRGDRDRWHAAIPNVIGPPLEYLLGNAVPHHPKRVAWLLAHGADASTNHAYSKEPIIKHALLGGADDVVRMLEQHGAKRPELSVLEAFCSVVMRGNAAETRRLAAAHPETLLDAGPLMIAARKNDVAVAELLLDLGVSPDVSAQQNFRALHAAAGAGSVDVAKLLIARGAEVDPFEQRYGGTPLSHANYQRQPEMLALLASHSRNIRGLCFAGCTDRLRELLVENPALANEPIHEKETPLFCLPDDEDKAIELAELLLSFGADMTAKNIDGLTPAEAARRRGLEDAATLLDP